MKYILLLALLSSFVMAKTELEEVQEMLLNLKNDIHQQILNLDKEWETTQKTKQVTIQNLKEQKNERINECTRRDQAIIDKQAEIQSVSDFMVWIQHRITVNKDRVAVLEELQCKQSLNFIDTIRDDKVAVTASIFVREQIARIISENTSFTQKTQAMKNIIEFLQSIRENKYQVIELQRTTEIELDENPILAEMGPIEFKKFNEAKDELLKALDELEQHITEHIPKAQNNMIRVGIAFYEWKVRTLKENETFTQKLEDLANLLTNLEDQLTALVHNAELCKTSIGDMDKAIQLAQQDAMLAYDQYINDHDRLMKELAIFQEIYKMYDREVDNTTTEAEKEALSKHYEQQDAEEGGEEEDGYFEDSNEEDTEDEEQTEQEEQVEQEEGVEDSEESSQELVEETIESENQTEETEESVETEETEQSTYTEETVEAEETEETEESVEIEETEQSTYTEETVEAEETEETEESSEQNLIHSQFKINKSLEKDIADMVAQDVEQQVSKQLSKEDNIITNGPLKLQEIEYDRHTRSDFILIQKAQKIEDMEELIL